MTSGRCAVALGLGLGLPSCPSAPAKLACLVIQPHPGNDLGTRVCRAEELSGRAARQERRGGGVRSWVDLPFRGIASVTGYSVTVPFTSEQATMKPDLGDVFGVVDAEVCAGPQGPARTARRTRTLSAFAVVSLRRQHGVEPLRQCCEEAHRVRRRQPPLGKPVHARVPHVRDDAHVPRRRELSVPRLPMGAPSASVLIRTNADCPGSCGEIAAALRPVNVDQAIPAATSTSSIEATMPV